MKNDTLRLSGQQVLQHARKSLEEHLSLQAEGYICSAEDLWNVLLGVGAKGVTIESVCADLVHTPDPETIRRYLNEQVTVESLPEWGEYLNAAASSQLM